MQPFAFGKNWQHFTASYLNARRIESAKKSLQDFLGMQSLQGKTFLDIGAGSGLYSLAAIELGASKVVSIDYDQNCILCCEHCKKHAHNPEHWTITKGSAIDPAFMKTLGTFDVVYSWGVLHHTGDMWNGIDLAMQCVKPGGVFFLAIYNKVEDVHGFYKDGRFGTSKFWLFEKKVYCAMPGFMQTALDFAVMGVLFVMYALTLRNPWKVIRSHDEYFSKGMPWRIMIKDWLGGYPYEVATVAEIFHFAKKRGFSLENLTCSNTLLNNEFLLKKHQ